MRQSFKIIILLFILSRILFSDPLSIKDILKGEDSAVLRAYLNVYNEYAANDKNVRILDIIMDTNGLSSAQKAQVYIKEFGSDPESNWLLLLLADYYVSSGNNVLAGGILDKAYRRDASITQDRYYRLIKGRIDGDIPDLLSEETTLDPMSKIHVNLSAANRVLQANDVLIDRSVELPGLPDKESAAVQDPAKKLYHLQIGAFSRKANAEERRDYFTREGFPAYLRVRATESGSVYVVWVGDYDDRESAQFGKEHLLNRYSTDSFIVKD